MNNLHNVKIFPNSNSGTVMMAKYCSVSSRYFRMSLPLDKYKEWIMKGSKESDIHVLFPKLHEYRKQFLVNARTPAENELKIFKEK